MPKAMKRDMPKADNDFDALLLSLDAPKKKKKKTAVKNIKKVKEVESDSHPILVPDEIPDFISSNDSQPKEAEGQQSMKEVLVQRKRVASKDKRPSPPVVRPIEIQSKDEEEFALFNKRKERTKVYAGKRKKQTTALSLVKICQNFMLANIEKLDKIDKISYELLEWVLERCTVNQLDCVSSKNPSLHEKMNNLWEQHVKKTFPAESLKENDKTWYNCYKRLQNDREQGLKEIKLKIKMPAASRKTIMIEHVVDTAVKKKPAKSPEESKQRKKKARKEKKELSPIFSDRESDASGDLFVGMPERSYDSDDEPSPKMSPKQSRPPKVNEPVSPILVRVAPPVAKLPPKKPAPMMAKLKRQMKIRR